MKSIFVLLVPITLLCLLCSCGNDFGDIEQRDPGFSMAKADSIYRNVYSYTPEEYVDNMWYIWMNRDGAIGHELMPYIAYSILDYPDLIFRKFERNPIAFNDLVDHLPFALFSDYVSYLNRDEMLCVRMELLRKLRFYRRDKKYKRYYSEIDRLIIRIKNSKIEIHEDLYQGVNDLF